MDRFYKVYLDKQLAPFRISGSQYMFFLKRCTEYAFYKEGRRSVIIELSMSATTACELPKMERKELKPLDDEAIRAFMDTIRGHRFEVDALKRHKVRQAEARLKAGPLWQEEGFVFTDEVGHHLSPNTVYHNYKRLVASIGLPEARLHDLRHSYAVDSLRAGDNIKTVQSNLGHHTAAFALDVYGHVTEEMKRASAERMEKFIKGLSGA